MMKLLILFSAVLGLAACGGRSDATGEVVPVSKICAYEKWKMVAVEGYLAPATIACEKASRKKTAGVVWCSLNLYGDESLAGPTLRVTITTTKWHSKNNNRLDPGQRTEPMQIFDNEGSPIPRGSKIRVFGTLPKSDKCEFGLVERIDRVS